MLIRVLPHREPLPQANHYFLEEVAVACSKSVSDYQLPEAVKLLAIDRQYVLSKEPAQGVASYSLGRFFGYAKERLSVRLSGRAYQALKKYYLEQARRSVEALKWEFSHFPYPAWGGVLKQTFAILKATNAVRQSTGLPVIPTSCVQTKRRALKPFEGLGAMKHSVAKAEFALAA